MLSMIQSVLLSSTLPLSACNLTLNKIKLSDLASYPTFPTFYTSVLVPLLFPLHLDIPLFIFSNSALAL